MDPYASQPGAYIEYMELPQEFVGGNLQPDLYMQSRGAHCIRVCVEFKKSVCDITLLFTLLNLTFTIVHLRDRSMATDSQQYGLRCWYFYSSSLPNASTLSASWTHLQ